MTAASPDMSLFLDVLPYLAPALGIIVSVATLIFTGINLVQKADTAYVNSLQARVKLLEEERTAWDSERQTLHNEIAQLSQLLLQSTLLIRGDVAANTEVSRAAFHEANSAKAAIAEAIQAVVEQTARSDQRLDSLEQGAATQQQLDVHLRDVAIQAAAALKATAAETAARLIQHQPEDKTGKKGPRAT